MNQIRVTILVRLLSKSIKTHRYQRTDISLHEANWLKTSWAPVTQSKLILLRSLVSTITWESYANNLISLTTKNWLIRIDSVVKKRAKRSKLPYPRISLCKILSRKLQVSRQQQNRNEYKGISIQLLDTKMIRFINLRWKLYKRNHMLLHCSITSLVLAKLKTSSRVTWTVQAIKHWDMWIIRRRRSEQLDKMMHSYSQGISIWSSRPKYKLS